MTVLLDGPIPKLSMSAVFAKSTVNVLGVMLATLLPRSVLKPACALIVEPPLLGVAL